MTLDERYDGIIGWFAENMPNVRSELNYRSPYQLLVAVILSAQCTDKRINMVTPALFERFPTAQSMAQVTEAEIYSYIKSVSYPNNKAHNLAGMARMLTEKYNGIVPDTIEELQKLPGVGRKTANVVASVAYNRPAMAVDTHVFRVSHRIGLVDNNAKTPRQVEEILTAHIPVEILSTAHHWLILHGRYVCIARKPRCIECGIKPWCTSVLTSENTPPSAPAPVAQ